jgi:hypothetical protein
VEIFGLQADMIESLIRVDVLDESIVEACFCTRTPENLDHMQPTIIFTIDVSLCQGRIRILFYFATAYPPFNLYFSFRKDERDLQ